MSRVATEYALSKLTTFLDIDADYKTLVLGSIHDIPFDYHRIIDWSTSANDNVNFMFDEINSEEWNLIINCCCEHMYPMSEVTLNGVYLLQNNNYHLGGYINRCSSLREHLDQIKLDHIYFADTKIFNGYEYYTAIGERCLD